MLSPQLIKDLIANVQLAIRDADHFNHVMTGLSGTLKDSEHLNSFDCFAFAWGLLPLWARVMLLAVAYRESKDTFTGITPETPIEHFTPPQREVLASACAKLLSATVTLMADWDFTEDFYRRWAPARREALQKQPQEQVA